MLAQIFDHARVVEEDLFTSIAAGLAIKAHDG
jgi:hypothetical protein